MDSQKNAQHRRRPLWPATLPVIAVLLFQAYQWQARRTIELHYRLGFESLQTGNRAAALNHFNAYWAARPGGVDVAKVLYSEALDNNNNRSLIEIARQVQGQSPDARLMRAEAADRLAWKFGRLTEANTWLSRELQQLPTGTTTLSDPVFAKWSKLQKYLGDSPRVEQFLVSRLQQEPTKGLPDLGRALWMLDTEPKPLNAIAELLSAIQPELPADKDAWLLAQMTNAYHQGDFAALESFQKRLSPAAAASPRGAFWQFMLQLIQQSSDFDQLKSMLQQLPATMVDQSLIDDIRARIAARIAPQNRDKLLKLWLTENPGATWPRENLIELYLAAENAEQAAAERQTKNRLNEIREKYRIALTSRPAPESAAQLAEMADALGRWNEYQIWAKLASVEIKTRVFQPSDSNKLLIDRIGTEWFDADATGRKLHDEPTNENRTFLFQDIATGSGITTRFQPGWSREHQLPETMSGGLAVLDIQNDGLMDLIVLTGGLFPPNQSGNDAQHPSIELYQNLGEMKFRNITKESGLGSLNGQYLHGISIADYDNDGDSDIFITGWGLYRLFQNDGRGHFIDVTIAAGFDGNQGWPTSSAWGDFDSDGDLDLYVCHYVNWNADQPTLCRRYPDKDEFLYCDPNRLEASPDHVWRNDSGHFTDISNAIGVTQADSNGRGLGVLCADLDNDGKIEIVVANDTTANYLWRPGASGQPWQETGLESGVAANASGGFQAGMGIGYGDLDGNGLMDLVVTNFYEEGVSFYRAVTGQLQFIESAQVAGISAVTKPMLGFGISASDFDNDGNLDLAVANGHVNDYSPFVPYAMPVQLLRNRGNAKFVNVGAKSGDDLSKNRVGRGLASADFDNDGRLDFAMVDQQGPFGLFHNQTKNVGHWIGLNLSGNSKSTKDAIGATISIEYGGRSWKTGRISGGSYQSASDPRIHVGLGNEMKDSTIQAARVQIKWPSGSVQTWNDLAIDKYHTLKEK